MVQSNLVNRPLEINNTWWCIAFHPRLMCHRVIKLLNILHSEQVAFTIIGLIRGTCDLQTSLEVSVRTSKSAIKHSGVAIDNRSPDLWYEFVRHYFIDLDNGISNHLPSYNDPFLRAYCVAHQDGFLFPVVVEAVEVIDKL